MSRAISVSNRSWILPATGGVIARVHQATTTTTIDHLGRPQRSEILSKKAGHPGRKMREVFTTSGYAILDNEVKLSTPNGLATLEQLSRDVLAGEKVLVEALQAESGVREQRDADIVPSPGAIHIDKAMVAKLITNIEECFASRKEVTIPRVCFCSVYAIFGRLRKKSRARLHCDVDNKIYPCELLIKARAGDETQILSITDFLEDEVTTVEIPSNCRAMVIDGLICS